MAHKGGGTGTSERSVTTGESVGCQIPQSQIRPTTVAFSGANNNPTSTIPSSPWIPGGDTTAGEEGTATGADGALSPKDFARRTLCAYC